MPRYYFNIYHTEPERDGEGRELPDKHAAWAQATQTAGEILKDLDGDLTPQQEWRLEVEDEFRQKLFVLHISAETVDGATLAIGPETKQ